jgi:hypothetical protein
MTACALLIFLAGSQNLHLLKMRRTYRLTQAEPLHNAPPAVAFSTMALGGFRGLLADLLWLRATRLQDEGHYFELNQLARWITQLEPRFPEIWAYHAWNLAYNVSVLFQHPEDRWRWVESGIQLLRDRGLTFNPGSPMLYRELGWLFQHKLGGAYDQAHRYYKQRWAANIEQLTDGARPDYTFWRTVPDSREALLEIPHAAALAQDLSQAGVDPWSDQILDTDTLSTTARKLLEIHPGSRWLRAFVQRQTLRSLYRMDPDTMQIVEREYGPLDWRLPQAHAIYWAHSGRPYAKGFAAVALDRMIFQSLADAFRQGRLYEDPDQDIFLPMPDIELLPKVKAAYERAITDHPTEQVIRDAYRTFLVEALVICYSHHHTGLAHELFEQIRKQYPDYIHTEDFETFVYRALAREFDLLSSRNFLPLIQGLLFQCIFWEQLGDMDRATGYQNLARLLWTRYSRVYDNPEIRERIGLPDYELLVERAREEVETALLENRRQSSHSPARETP